MSEKVFALFLKGEIILRANFLRKRQQQQTEKNFFRADRRKKTQMMNF